MVRPWAPSGPPVPGDFYWLLLCLTGTAWTLVYTYLLNLPNNYFTEFDPEDLPECFSEILVTAKG
jgi:hypothetical protein